MGTAGGSRNVAIPLCGKGVVFLSHTSNNLRNACVCCKENSEISLLSVSNVFVFATKKSVFATKK